MRQHRSAPIRGALTFVAVVAAVALTGCVPPNLPSTETQGAVSATGTVQATLPSENATATTTTPGASAGTTMAASKAAPAVPTLWPAKVGLFAKNVSSLVWYPKSLPGGYKADSIDIVELDKGTGLICDIVYLKGDKALMFTQGSPKTRDYPIVSTGKVPWGTAKADVVHQDPTDPSSPVVIVYSSPGNFAELQGDATLAELKAVAASMVLVK
jgi:hypothetical protein